MTDGHYIMKNGTGLRLGRGFDLESAPDQDPIELERAAAHHGVRALVSLCEGLIRPMSFTVTRQWVDDEFGVVPAGRPPRRNWFAKAPQALPIVKPGFVDPQVIEVATLDEQAMLAVVDRALDDPCTAPDGDRLAWEELWVDHTWARLPEPELHVQDGELLLGESIHRYPMALDHTGGHVWASAPALGEWQPFMLRVTRQAVSRGADGTKYAADIDLDVDVYWSFWWEPGEGRDMLDRAVDRLREQGWSEKT